ncbi:MAG TPA: acyl-CoA dehydrogenase family protein [Dehalococcoidia bacterium]
MDFRDSPEDAAFRQEVRDFIQRELPDEIRRRDVEWGAFNAGGGRWAGVSEAARRWRAKLAERGWIAPAWPKEYGGAGLTVMQQFIFNEEMALHRAPAGGGIGVGWAGPTIIVYGTEEQKRRFLPPILRGETIWCQGFSEPGAGSDLAALQTRAVRDGDEYVINGQKIWTSGAHVADWMILLARTDPNAPKHRGISYFLVDMKSPGITVRPLVNMAGSHDFNEVFFEDVRVPKENLVGEENRGWYVGTTTLDFERSNIATSVSQLLIVGDLAAFAREHRGQGWVTVDRDRAVRYELADRAVETEVARVMSYRVISMQARGMVPNHEASVAKLYTSELDQRIAATGMKLVGLYGQLGTRDDRWAPLRGKITRMYLYAVSSTIGGGTSEIQRNIIAMRGLGLPRG